MQSERPNAGDEFTSVWIGDNETETGGSFTASFDGSHGWFWQKDQPPHYRRLLRRALPALTACRRHGGKAGAEQGDHLSREKMPEASIV
ncbi:hypothetical protein [Marinobacterium rhizophilum]|uniref:hypothetical protein n=1 Tax=Marinobacterium rhizophilum TaxID=420402 RepID=UPI000371DBD3|nr:hypothetical protein [Marinobacterium rhizophilum]